jgi:RimJ/RimL family protein N-acetyltransferase
MDRKFFLDSDRVKFSIWDDTDLVYAKILWGDDEVTKYIGGPFNEEMIQKRLLLETQNQERFKIQYWPLFLKENGSFIGCCGLRPYKEYDAIREMGFHLCRQYWGYGLATEAAKRVMEYAFNGLKVSRLFAGHNPKNEQSKRTLLKLGFRYIRDEYYPPTRLNHPSYEIEAKEYE